MPKKSFSVDQIINHLREADVLLAQGGTVGEVCRSIGVSEQTYYRWREEYGGLKVNQTGATGAGRREAGEVALLAHEVLEARLLQVLGPVAGRVVMGDVLGNDLGVVGLLRHLPGHHLELRQVVEIRAQIRLQRVPGRQFRTRKYGTFAENFIYSGQYHGELLTNGKAV